jgi:hypothetical protein
MNYIRAFFLLLVVAFSPVVNAYYQAPAQEKASETIPWSEVVEHAKQTLPQSGELLMKEGGFVYVHVDDNYIHSLFPMLGLKDKGYREPPYFRTKSSPGAHISVFYEDENVSPEEIGQTFQFTLENITIVHVSRHVAYAILQVQSPQLEELRKRYGLSPKLHGHEFHITLAKKIYRQDKR